MIDWLKEAADIAPQLIETRRHLHMIPEIGNCEFKTSAFIREQLAGFGIETVEVIKTGIIGILKGASPGKTVAFRSDIDALQIKEETGLPFASKHDGFMHACGHDMHMSALLGAARLLAKHRDEIKGTIKFIFQPDEEGGGGAQRIIKTGLLDDCQAIFGCHVNPDLKPGVIGVREGNFYAAGCHIDITVLGKGSHGAEPEKGIDPIYAGALLEKELKEMTGVMDGVKVVVSIGSFHGGTMRNVIPDEVRMSGILRTFGIAEREKMMELVRKRVSDVEKATGARIELAIATAYPGVVNHTAQTNYVRAAAQKMLGRDRVEEIPEPTMTSEDFGYYILDRPGCFYHLGVGSPYPLHSARFNPDESALPTGAGLAAGILTSYKTE